MYALQTVLGPVNAQDIGIALVHEHLLSDLQCWFEAPSDPTRKFLVDAPVSASIRAYLNSDPYHCRDNMLLTDSQVVCAELEYFRSLGGRTVVDLSTRSLGPYPLGLAEIARTTGLNIVAATGFYVQRSHPEWVATASLGELADFMVNELQVGIDGTNVRAGIIGEIGVSSPIQPDEAKVVRAAASAQKRTDVAINMHLPIFSRVGHEVIDLLEAEGANLNRVVLSHLDETNDFTYIDSLAKRGVYIELDTFGSEVSWDETGGHEPSDWQRLDLLIKLIEAGHLAQILLSHDICTKMQLMRYGGAGFGHILRTIVPRLRQHLNDDDINALLIANPVRMLCG